MIFVGIDWSEKHHDVEVLGEDGKRLRSLRVEHGVEGLSKLQEVLVELSQEPEQVAVAVESDHGLLVNALIGCGYAVYPVNPKVAARYRDRDSVAGAKSDRRDAEVLANLVRTDRHKHQRLAGDSPEGLEVRARARAHLRAVKAATRLRLQLRSLLLEFYPAAVELLQEEQLRDGLAVLSVAPNPTLGRRLSLNKIQATLRRHGRQRNLEQRGAEIQQLLRAPQLELNSPRLVSAHSDEVASLVRRLVQARIEVETLQEQMTAAFRSHPDAEIYLSFPGLADTLGARVLGESGDDPTRYSDARARCNYAGNAPITRASGKKREVHRRVVRNRRLADATFRMAESAVNTSPGARRYYDRQTNILNKPHNTAIRAVANKLIAKLHACLEDHRLYDEALAWPPEISVQAA
jgi:transposase